MKDLWPMFCAREQICDPLPYLMKDRNVDQRFCSFASCLLQQFDGAIHSMDQIRSILSKKQENISSIVRHANSSPASGFLLDRKQCSRAC